MTIQRTSIAAYCWRLLYMSVAIHKHVFWEVQAFSSSVPAQPLQTLHGTRAKNDVKSQVSSSTIINKGEMEWEFEQKDADSNEKNHISCRRKLFAKAFAASTALTALSMTNPAAILPASAAAATTTLAATSTPSRLSSTWSATSGLNSLLQSPGNFVSFDPSAYAAMRDDPTRTPLFKKALQDRLNAAPGGPESQTVLDLGTGPFALFAIFAAEYGAGHVFAMEANPIVANQARATITKLGWNDVITVLDGFSTEITLPDSQKVDIIVAEVVGSIASEEGAYATIFDAHRRLLKDPTNANNWIPNRIQTWAAPVSYTLHSLLTPPEFDWTKIATEPVRFNCRDLGLALLDDPQCVEDIYFADIVKNDASTKLQQQGTTRRLSFTASADRMDETTAIFFDEYRRGNQIPQSQASELAIRAAHSFTGVAFWPRLFLPNNNNQKNTSSNSFGSDGENDSWIINSRRHPDGGPQRSHWQTVLPIMGAVPVEGIRGGDRMEVTCTFVTRSDTVAAAPRYNVVADIYTSAGAANNNLHSSL